jgi:hypothetical protein
MALQANLGRRVATVLGDAQSANHLSAKQVLAVETEIEKFIEELPPIFRVKDPDTSLDQSHPYFVFQRHQLHCVIFVTMLDFLKPYLTRDRNDKLTDNDDEFRKRGINIALRLLGVARNLFDHEFPINAKFHMVVFSIFDTATLLCSAIIHNHDHALPQRQEVMDVIESSLGMLHQLSLTTKLGASSYNFLYKLVQATPELARHSPIRKRHKNTTAVVPKPTPPVPGQLPPVIMAPVDQTLEITAGVIDSLPSMTTSDDLSFDVEHFLANNPFGSFGDSANVDMGGMEQIWDWESLHLDSFSQSGSMA